MSHRWCYVVVLATLAHGVASPQSTSPDLSTYLNLTAAQAKSINDLNKEFNDSTYRQQSAYSDLRSQAAKEFLKDTPDVATVGDAYAQMEMIRRDYFVKLEQARSKVAAVLTVDHAMRVNELLSVLRLQPLVVEAQCAYLEAGSTYYSGSLSPVAIGTAGITASTCVPPVPTALATYLNLTDRQVALIENAILGYGNFVSRQTLRISELQNEIADLTAAPTIDSARLGADYLAIVQMEKDEGTQAQQLTTTVRGILTEGQQPLLKALDNAANLNLTAVAALGANLFVPPPDYRCRFIDSVAGIDRGFPFNLLPIEPFNIPYVPFPSSSCGVSGLLSEGTGQ